jgi:uncharacterized membrane protein
MEFADSIAIDAPAERVWAVMSDVERWHEWTPSITSVERLDRGTFRLGSRARVRQPKLPTAVWTVTDLQPNCSFIWTAGARGLLTIATHQILPGPGTSVTVRLSIRQTGLLAPLVNVLYAGLTRRYLKLEVNGLKQRCEGTALASAA